MEESKTNQGQENPEADKLKQLGAMMQERRLNNYIDLNRLAQKNGVVFAGDSITEHFPVHELLVSKKPVYNRGISGYTTQDMLRGIKHLVLELEPSQVILLIGTNDLGEGVLWQEVVKRIAALCSAIRDGVPNAELTVLSLYPVNAERERDMPFPVVRTRTNEDIRAINEGIRELSAGLTIHYLDVYELLCDGNGWLRAEYTYDGLHLGVSGYEAIRPQIQKLMK
ncbi:hypothetical protein A7K91_20075 [Paenibacillus oryzae]|uniref:SGNH hydrolase-type esterase domain-containing protein n=1 Tax=Paenibacillus oryzae TaxID=1844972 RepID=A0A1A5YI57_9BACL|nr:GDSL-type esterase/lipase family protein [Paenibacillus oryzae]OBR65282.1 hypothetical protein A7K91_20075 [Paenibacillus oryzae]